MRGISRRAIYMYVTIIGWLLLYLGAYSVAFAIFAVMMFFWAHYITSNIIEARRPAKMIEAQNAENLARKAIEARRSQQYEVFRHITREDFESLFRPLDIHSEYSLDLAEIVGEENATKLMRQWYPEKWCINCREIDAHPGEQCPQDYADAIEAKIRADNKANRKVDGIITYGYNDSNGAFIFTKSNAKHYYC